MHYNLWASRQPDQKPTHSCNWNPPKVKLADLKIVSMAAPVEIPCPSGTEGPQCEREVVIERVGELYGEDVAPHGPITCLREGAARTLADYAANTGENASGYCDYPVTESYTLFGVSGHMHELGRSFRLELNPASEEPLLLLDIPNWDFHWQDHYYFVEPLEIAAGDVLRMTCRWDNSLSDNPRYVVWGQGTADEMCFGTVMGLEA